MLSFHHPSFRSHYPIDCYIKSNHDLFPHALYPPEPHRKFPVPAMQTSVLSLESISEPFIPSDLSTNSIAPFDNSKSPVALLMTQKRTQSLQLRSVPYSQAATNPISNFDWEYALLEHALRKDRSSSSVPKIMEEQPQKCSSPLLEPEFYFGDILGDDAIPPQPLVNICKEEDKIQPDELDQVAEATNFASYEQKLPISDNNHLTHTGFSHQTHNSDTDLSTALASLVSSHVSSESISTKNLEHSNAKIAEVWESENNYQVSSKRRALGCDLERPAKYTRYTRDSEWVAEAQRTCDQNSELDPNRTSVTETVYSGFLRGERDHQNGLPVRDDDDLLGSFDPTMHSPVSDSSMTRPGVRSHPDLYENLTPDIREKVDRLRQKISAMPRRKLRESLAQGVSLKDIEPLMCLNRDELAGMLGVGVTTLKIFVHNTLQVPRWPARALKSQRVKVQKLVLKKIEAERKGDEEQAKRVQRDLTMMTQVQVRKKRSRRESRSGRSS